MRVASLIAFLIGIVLSTQISTLFGQDMSGLVVDVSEMADGSISQARLEAARQAESGGLPFRSFRQGEYRMFSGQYTPPELPEEKKGQFLYGLAMFSDDGCSVTVRGSSVLARLAQPQHLPNLGESFQVLPVALVPGKPVEITVDYFNTIYVRPRSGLPDIDGFTLFLYLIPIAIAVDANRDGNIVFDGESKDITSEERPFRFWINDDFDGIPNDEREVVPAAERDYEDATIQTFRDLEDFSRLYLHIGGLQDWIADGTFKVGLKFSDASGGDATINVYKSTDRDGSSSYLTDEEAALAQISAKDAQALGQVTSGDPLILPTDFWTGSAQQNPVKCFLFEGYREGKGQLVLTVHKGDGTQIGEAGSCWLDLMNIKKMYQRARATPEFSDRPYDHMDAWSPLAIGSEPYDAGQAFSKPEDEDSNVIVYVHGINGPGGQGAEYASWMADSETVLKRLWHQGYKGRFAAFKWLALTPALPFRFNESEYRAWKCGRGLARFVDNLPSNYSKNLYSFSQGAPVCGAALTVYGLSVDNYVMSQAAAPAGCYDTNPSINSYADFLNAEATTPTPDTTNDLGYREYLTRLNVSGAVVSFYNTTDYALKTGRLLAENVSWEGNQITYKPNANLGTLGYRSYAYDFGTPNNPYPVGQRCFLRDVYAPFNYRQLTDIHESMSFVARPRSEAAGANTSVGGSISGRYNVGPDTPTNLQNSSNDHGGQFSRRIQQTWPYYENLVGVFVEE